MLITYTLEILPYAIRAKGFALMVRHNPSFSCHPYSPAPLKESGCIISASTQPVRGSLGSRCDGLEICESQSLSSLKEPGLINRSISFSVVGWVSSWSSLSYS
jgi:hypothetical protein